MRRLFWFVKKLCFLGCLDMMSKVGRNYESSDGKHGSKCRCATLSPRSWKLMAENGESECFGRERANDIMVLNQKIK